MAFIREAMFIPASAAVAGACWWLAAKVAHLGGRHVAVLTQGFGIGHRAVGIPAAGAGYLVYRGLAEVAALAATKLGFLETAFTKVVDAIDGKEDSAHGSRPRDGLTLAICRTVGVIAAGATVLGAAYLLSGPVARLAASQGFKAAAHALAQCAIPPAAVAVFTVAVAAQMAAMRFFSEEIQELMAQF